MCVLSEAHSSGRTGGGVDGVDAPRSLPPLDGRSQRVEGAESGGGQLQRRRQSREDDGGQARRVVEEPLARRRNRLAALHPGGRRVVEPIAIMAGQFCP